MKPFVFLWLIAALPALAGAQSFPDAPLPEILAGAGDLLQVSHYPDPVKASRDADEPGTWFWKHTTTVFSPDQNIRIRECGAYIFYNEQWNLRAKFNSKQFADWFNCPEGKMKAGEPYTFVQNWRRDTRLYGGWALWYFIGEDDRGKPIVGYKALWTAGESY
jgi:hypothetical protein